MILRGWLIFSLALAFLLACVLSEPAPACCPAPPSGKPVVNADQTVIILWDAVAKKQHFIRKASFKSAADDFGFIVPSPNRPELSESGNEAFGYLQKLTEPEVKIVSRPAGGGGMGCGCAAYKSSLDKGEPTAAKKDTVRVLEQKLVAGFHATVLEADSAAALTQWLKENQYAYSPEVEAWAKPYIELKWKFTALKVAKDKESKEQKDVAASALRISFDTDRPLFPYREPDSKSAAEKLGANRRLLRIYFLGEARYRGELTKEVSWTGRVTWANPLKDAARKQTLELLKLPENTGPATWWLTEFEDNWPYQVAPADVYFARDTDQSTIKREPIIQYVASPWPTDVTVPVLAGVLVLPLVFRWFRRGRQPQGNSDPC